MMHVAFFVSSASGSLNVTCRIIHCIFGGRGGEKKGDETDKENFRLSIMVNLVVQLPTNFVKLIFGVCK